MSNNWKHTLVHFLEKLYRSERYIMHRGQRYRFNLLNIPEPVPLGTRYFKMAGLYEIVD